MRIYAKLEIRERNGIAQYAILYKHLCRSDCIEHESREHCARWPIGGGVELTGRRERRGTLVEDEAQKPAKPPQSGNTAKISLLTLTASTRTKDDNDLFLMLCRHCTTTSCRTLWVHTTYSGCIRISCARNSELIIYCWCGAVAQNTEYVTDIVGGGFCVCLSRCSQMVFKRCIYGKMCVY